MCVGYREREVDGKVVVVGDVGVLKDLEVGEERGLVGDGKIEDG
jgi:hypothetical protein